MSSTSQSREQQEKIDAENARIYFQTFNKATIESSIQNLIQKLPNNLLCIESFNNIITNFDIYVQNFHELPPVDNDTIECFITQYIPFCIKFYVNNHEYCPYFLCIICAVSFFLIQKKHMKILKFLDILLISNLKLCISPLLLEMYCFRGTTFFVTNFPFKDQELVDEIQKEIRQTLRPNKDLRNFSIKESLVNILFLNGIFIEVRKYLVEAIFTLDDNLNNSDVLPETQNEEENFDIVLDFLKKCLPAFGSHYRSYFASEVKQKIESGRKVFATKYTFKFFKLLREFSDLSDDLSVYFNNQYFRTIYGIIEIIKKSGVSAFKVQEYNKIIYEGFRSICEMTIISESFIQNLSDTFFNLIKESYDFGYNDKIIMNVVNLLKSKNKLPNSGSLFEICQNNIFCCLTLFNFLAKSIPNTYLDDLYNIYFLSQDETKLKTHVEYINLAKLIVLILKSDFEQITTNIALILEKLLIIFSYNHDISFQEDFLYLSHKSELQIPLITAIKKSLISDLSSENADHKIGIIFICRILANCFQNENLESISSESVDFPFDFIAERVIFEIDSCFIPIVFTEFSSFLKINDYESFFDLSCHNSLFYKLIEPKAYEIKEEIIEIDDFDEFNEELSAILLEIFLKDKSDFRFYYKSIFVTYYSSIFDKKNDTKCKENSDLDQSNKTKEKLVNIFNELVQDENEIKNLIQLLNFETEKYGEKGQLIYQKSFELYLCDVFEAFKFKFELCKLEEFLLIDIKLDSVDKISMKLFLTIFKNTKVFDLETLNANYLKEINNEVIEKLLSSDSSFAKTVVSSIIYCTLSSYPEDGINKQIFVELSKNINIEMNKINSKINKLFKESYLAGNEIICKNLIKLTSVSVNDQYIYKSPNPSLIKLIFKEKIQQKKYYFGVNLLLQNCTTYEQYEETFLSLLKKEPSLPMISTVFWKLLTSNEFPACFRQNEKIIKKIMERISEFPDDFLAYLSNFDQQYPHSQVRPSMNAVIIQIFSNLPQIIFDINDQIKQKDLIINNINNYPALEKEFFDSVSECKKVYLDLENVLTNLNFSAISDVKTNNNSCEFLNFLKILPTSSLKFFEIISTNTNIFDTDYDKNKNNMMPKIISKIRLDIEGEKSLSFSVEKYLSSNFQFIIKAPKILLIYFTIPVDPQKVLIDENLDISGFCSHISTFSLNSVYTINHKVFLRSRERGYNNFIRCAPFEECRPQDSIDGNVSLVIYTSDNQINEQVSFFDDFALFNETKKYYTFDEKSEFMKILNCKSINWNLFMKNEACLSNALSIVINLHIGPLFDCLQHNENFSLLFFRDKIEILSNKSFSSKFENNIINLAKVFPNEAELVCILCIDVINENPSLAYKILNSIDFSFDNLLSGILMIPENQMNNNPVFNEFFINRVVKHKDASAEQIIEIIENNFSLFLMVFQITNIDPMYNALLKRNLTKEQFMSLLNVVTSSYIVDYLITFRENNPIIGKNYFDLIEFSSEKLLNDKKYQDMFLNEFRFSNLEKEDENSNIRKYILSISCYRNLFMAKNETFRDKLVEIFQIQYPPSENINSDISSMIINIIEDTKFYSYFMKLVSLYRKSFGNSARITTIYIKFLFSTLKKNSKDLINQEIFDSISEFIFTLPVISISILSDIAYSLFNIEKTDYFEDKDFNLSYAKLNQNMAYNEMIGFEKYYSLFFKFFKQIQFKNIPRDFPYEGILVTCYQMLSSSDSSSDFFSEIFQTLLVGCKNPDSGDLAVMLPHFFHFPKALSECIEQLCDMDIIKNSFLLVLMILLDFQILERSQVCMLYVRPNENVDEYVIKIIKTTNELYENYPLNVNWQPKLTPKINFRNIMDEFIIPYTLSSPILLKKASNNYMRMEIIRFYKNLALILPSTLGSFVYSFSECNILYNYYTIFSQIRRDNSLSHNINNSNKSEFLDMNEEVKASWSKFVCEIYRESLGNTQIVQSLRSPMFSSVNIFFNFQFSNCLCSSSLIINFRVVEPYVNIIVALLRLPFGNELRNFVVSQIVESGYHVILSMILKVFIQNENQYNRIVEFFLFMIKYCKYTNEGDSLIINIRALGSIISNLTFPASKGENNEVMNDFNYKINLIKLILEESPKDTKEKIIENTFDYVENLSLENGENEAIQDLFNFYLIESS